MSWLAIMYHLDCSSESHCSGWLCLAHCLPLTHALYSEQLMISIEDQKDIVAHVSNSCWLAEHEFGQQLFDRDIASSHQQHDTSDDTESCIQYFGVSLSPPLTACSHHLLECEGAKPGCCGPGVKPTVAGCASLLYVSIYLLHGRTCSLY